MGMLADGRLFAREERIVEQHALICCASIGVFYIVGSEARIGEVLLDDVIARLGFLRKHLVEKTCHLRVELGEFFTCDSAS